MGQYRKDKIAQGEFRKQQLEYLWYKIKLAEELLVCNVVDSSEEEMCGTSPPPQKYVIIYKKTLTCSTCSTCDIEFGIVIL